MRLLLFADVHLDTQFAWAGPELARVRRRALREALQRICALADEQKVEALLCGGDLYEQERFSPDTQRFLQDLFAEVHPLPVFLAPGNHDWYGAESLYRQATWSDNVHLFTEPRLTPVALTDGCTLWGAAHCAPANTDGFLDGFRVDRGGVNLALFHGSETAELVWQEGGKAPHAPFSGSQIPASGLDHAFCGHFHTPKDARWHTYPGNPDPLTFGETGERGAVIADVADDGSVTRSRHGVAVSEVHDCTVNLTGVTHSGEVRERVAAELKALEGGVVRVTLEGEVEPEVDVQLSDLRSGWDHVEAVVVRQGNLAVAHDVESLRAEKSVRGEFVRLVCDDSDLDDDTRRRVLTTGLRALAGQCELEVL